ncbi:sphingomyelin phosphodiesterase [Collybia nuda]|uniref:Sphingomyelin phosphodiesterase n=1 Tax=Collybia nuda TaxID=64659 RepID=A0A9P5YGR3_9AGAR|nr:sphingomyelin phosphodiesterase [Collybia nuda]
MEPLQVLAHTLFTVLLLFFSVTNASLVNDLTASLVQTEDCDSCRDLLASFQTIALTGDDAFISTFVSLCTELQLEDSDVCNGLFSAAGPIIAHDLRQINITGVTAGRLCDALFGLCSSSTATQFKFPLPPTPTRPPQDANKVPVARKRPFQVVHISDVHIDREYTVGADANCTKPICCRAFADEAGKPVTVPALPNGNSKCDSPVSLADSMLDMVNEINPKFVIFTGDVVEGATWLVDQSEVEFDLSSFDAQLLARVKAPIYPSLAPVNSFARKTSMAVNDSQWVYDTQSVGWTPWIDQTSREQVKHESGSYSSLVHGTNLRILSLNTQFWYKQNFWLYDSDTFQPDPNGVLEFMAQQLDQAERAKQKVWVIGHIPLGKEDTMEDQSNYYDQILQRYKDTLVGQFFGHSHKDQFEIAYSDYNNQTAANAVAAALIAPALTPTSGNPAFKLYDVDPDTFGIMDVRVIFTNVSEPSFQVKPEWSTLYSARETYGPLVGLSPHSELTPAFWHKLTDAFVANETAFQLFNTFISRGGAVTVCDAACKNTTICDMRAFRSENNCDTPSGGLTTLRKRSDNTLPIVLREASECEGLGVASLLSRMRLKLKSLN